MTGTARGAVLTRLLVCFAASIVVADMICTFSVADSGCPAMGGTEETNGMVSVLSLYAAFMHVLYY